MTKKFYTIVTNRGSIKLANALTLGAKLNLTTLSVGDGAGSYYEPSENQTTLKNQLWSGKINSISIEDENPNCIKVRTILPATVGPFTVREVGIFDDTGTMIAIAKYPETYKPVLSEGSSKEVIINLILKVSNTSAVNLNIDPGVITATKKDLIPLQDEILVSKVSLCKTTVSKLTKFNNQNKQLLNFGVKGKTFLNLLGDDGSCEDVSKWASYSATTVLDCNNKVFGNNGFKITITDMQGSINNGKSLGNILKGNTTKYYCFSAYIKSGNLNNGMRLAFFTDSKTAKVVKSDLVKDDAKFNRTFIKFAPSDYGREYGYISCDVECVGQSGQYGYVDGIMLNEITEEEYNDASYTPPAYGEFDYSVGENPETIRTCGKNLLDLVQGSFDTNNKGVYIYGTTRLTHRYGNIAVNPNTKYTISLDNPLYYRIMELDKDRIPLPFMDWSNYTITNYTFITGANTHYVSLAFRIDDTTILTPEDYEVQFEEDEIATPYESYKESLITINEPLYSLNKDVYDEITIDGNLIKRIEKLVLDGSYDLNLDTGHEDYKRIKGKLKGTESTGFAICIRNDTILDGWKAIESKDSFWFTTNNDAFYITIPNDLSGWGKDYRPTTNEVKAYFNGWKMYNNSDYAKLYNGIGEKAWAYRDVNGAGGLSGGTATVPTTIAPNFTPHRLYYQLATPQIKVFDNSLVADSNSTLIIDSDRITELNYVLSENMRSTLDKTIDEVMSVKNRSYLNDNLLINGDFQIWQRGEAFENVKASYTSDRWLVRPDGNAVRVSKSNNNLKIENPNNTNVFLTQMIEFGNKYVGKTCTLSIKTNLGITKISGIVSTNYVQSGNNDTPNLYFVFNSSKNVIEINYVINYSSMEIEWVKFEIGDKATEFRSKPYGKEFRDCERYFERIGVGYSSYLFQVMAIGGNKFEGGFNCEVRKRMDSPTVIFNKTENYRLRYWDSSLAVDTIQGGGIDGRIIFVSGTTKSNLSSQPYYLQRQDNMSGAYIDVDAEIYI